MMCSTSTDLIFAVYDVTDYKRDHPGGPDALIEVAGTDATSAYEDVGHSEDAREILNTLIVGSLKGASSAPTGPKSGSSAPTVQIVRRGPSRQESSKVATGSSAIYYAEVVAVVLGISSVIWVASQSESLRHAADIVKGQGGFVQGFLLAGVTTSVLVVAGLRYLQSITQQDKDPFHLPAHKAASHVVLSSHHAAGSLAPGEYRKFRLTRKTELSNGIWKFVFALPTSTSTLGLPIGQHIAIRGDVDDHTVTRSYTPISNNRDLGRLELMIRIYPDGQLGKYLTKIEVGDNVDIRGPKGSMRYRKGMSKRLGMVGGGTGITPLYQLIRAICEDKTDTTEVSLVYANRSEADIMMRQQLDDFAKNSNGQFRVHYMLDHPSDEWKGGKGYVTEDILKQWMPEPQSDFDETKILICGPPPMSNAVEKALVNLGYQKPGIVSKMSDQVFVF
jgi:cytochrome-b5 reductase